MKNALLLLVALICAAILVPLGILFSIIKAVRRHKETKFGNALSEQCRNVALAIDILGNVVCAPLLNAIFINNGAYHFGNQGETISSVLGKNQLLGKLTWAGEALANLLDLIDPDHCFNSIDSI